MQHPKPDAGNVFPLYEKIQKGHGFLRKRLDKIAFTSTDGLHIITLPDIIYCAADGNYTQIHCRNGEKFLISKTLKHVAKAIPPVRFVRVHHSFIVNIEDIVTVQSAQLKLAGGQYIPVSRQGRIRLMDRLRNELKFL
jgi:two-component system LytT family response regulator